MPGLRFDDKLSLELTIPSTVPPGRRLSASLPGTSCLCSLDIFLCVFQAPEGRTENSPGLQPWESKASRLTQAGSNHAACRFGHFGSPEGRKQNSPWASALGRRAREESP